MIRNHIVISKVKKIFSPTGLGHKGFTVIEFLVAFALMSILLAGMIKIFIVLNQSYTTQNVAAGVQQVVRTAIGIMSQHIRMAGFNPLKIPDVGIQGPIMENSSSIHFTYDLTEDGSISISDAEDITYLYEDQMLKRRLGDGKAEAFIDNVTDLKFNYLDEFDQTTANPSAVKTVLISMTVTEPAGRRKSLSRTYSTRVICRNQ